MSQKPSTTTTTQDKIATKTSDQSSKPMASTVGGTAPPAKPSESKTDISSTSTSAQSEKAKGNDAKPKKKKASSAKTKKNLSAIDAAAKLLAESDESMKCKDLIELMSKKKLWTSPNGATPHATLYAAILREIQTKGKDSRFKKTGKGLFAFNKKS